MLEPNPDTVILSIGESLIPYYFDFTDDPIITSGGSISSPSIAITNGNSLVTFGTPTVLAADHVEYDRNGITTRTIESGKGVSITLTPGSVRGQITAVCTVTGSDSSHPSRTVYLRVH